MMVVWVGSGEDADIITLGNMDISPDAVTR